MTDAVPARRRSRPPVRRPVRHRPQPPAHPADRRPATGSMTGVPWHPAARLEPSRVSTPRPAAVIVLAAGEGTRMKSTTPKVLHPIGGVALVGHAIARGARHRGRARRSWWCATSVTASVAVCTSIDADLVFADQDEIKGTGRAVECGLLALPAELVAPCWSPSGDVPLLNGDTLVELARAPRRERLRRVGASPHASPTRPATAASCAATTGEVDRIVEQKDATDAERAHRPRSTRASTPSSAEVLRERAGAGRHRQRAGREVPHRRRRHRPRRRPRGARPACSTTSGRPRASTTGCSSPAVGRELNRRVVRAAACAPASRSSTPPRRGSTSTSASARTPPCCPAPSCSAPRPSATDAVVGPDMTLTDAEVGDGAQVTRAVANLAVIGPGATVGPFSYLRPGTRLGAGGKIGGFVETKNADIGDGAKVPHLSYVGDVTIGEGAEHRCRHDLRQLRRRREAPLHGGAALVRRLARRWSSARSTSATAPTSVPARP